MTSFGEDSASVYDACLPAGTSGAYAYLGSVWRLSGHLRSSTGKAVTNATVTLYGRSAGSSTWSPVARTSTSAGTASYRFGLRPSASATYKVGYAGGVDYAASWSYERSQSVKSRYGTSLTAATSASTIRTAGSVRLTGKLTRTSWQQPITSRSAVVYQHGHGEHWRKVRTLRTSAHAASDAFTLHPTPTTAYKVVFVGTTSNASTRSQVRVVHDG